MLQNYSIVEAGKLAASARPGAGETLRGELEQLKADGITAIVSLTETCLDPDTIRKAGFVCLHLPVIDFNAPAQAQFQQFCDFVERHTSEGKGGVLVHCGAGIGRTGTMLCAWFIKQGMTTDQAVDHVRHVRPGSVETRSQIQALRQWEASLRK